MRTRLTPLCLIGLLCAFGACRASAQVTLQWMVDGETREAIMYAPAARGRPVPLVLAFHGFGDNMHNFQGVNLHTAWPEAIVVYFQGLERRRGLPGWQVEQRDGSDRDLKLVDEALTSLRGEYNIDDDRIYATGFSNGGMFTYLLWAERPQVFAAYAPVAARLRPSVRPTQPRPIFHVAGQRDRQVDFVDQTAAIDIAISANDVRGTTTPCGDGCTIHGPGTSAPVMAWIHAGSHVYPRETSERIVAFFRDHARTNH
jgi:polyhydroxybutyrate depolymerase